jgi:4-amino-4-deoxychorismate lyase
LNVWINGRHSKALDYRDRGLHYGDGVFETMRVQRRRIRLLEFHLERLHEGCRRLALAPPADARLRGELMRAASGCGEGILKLILTRGSGTRGYRPSGRERGTRILTLHALSRGELAKSAAAVRVRLCSTALSTNSSLAGLKTLNRLDSVLARSEWRDPRIWEGLMSDRDGNWVCGTMSNLFVRHGAALATPLLDRSGVAGVMRRWILDNAGIAGLRAEIRRIGYEDLESAEEIFMSNAVVGLRSVRSIEGTGRATLRFADFGAADRLRRLLERQ